MSSENWKESLRYIFDELIKAGKIDSPTDRFRSEVIEKTKKISLEEDLKKIHSLGKIETVITLGNNYRGHLIISSSFDPDFEKETLAAAYVTKIFSNNEKQTTLIFNIDDIYSLPPYEPSLVGKIVHFEKLRRILAKEKKYAIILTGFSCSEIFKKEILDKIPNQDNARLTYFFVDDPSSYSSIEFGKKLYEFSYYLQKLFVEKKGVINEVIEEIKRNKDQVDDEGMRLLLATGLLLQDKQTWQNLWFEGQEDTGTFLIIIAPASFHHAMNRLNKMWGHGAYDYFYRASIPRLTEPIFEEKERQEVVYESQGLNKEDFIRLTEPWLDSFTQSIINKKNL